MLFGSTTLEPLVVGGIVLLPCCKQCLTLMTINACFLLFRYLLRVTVTGKGMVTDTKREAPFWVRNYELPPEEAPPIKMEVSAVHLGIS